MNNMKEIDELIKSSHAVGTHPELIQGGGGNTSVKSDDGIMHIKASGTTLKEMSQDKGYSSIDFKTVVDRFSSVSERNDLTLENELTCFVTEKAAEHSHEGMRPSMETSMHAYLKKYVVHTHPVHLNVFSCLENGQEHIKKFLPEFSWMPYVNPGYNLGLETLNIMPDSEPQIIVLQNHGLTVASDQAGVSEKLNIEINASAKRYMEEELNLDGSFETGSLEFMNHPSEKFASSNHQLIAEFCQNIEKLEEVLKKSFFPDFIVYGKRNCSFSKETAKSEELAEQIDQSQKAHMLFVENRGVIYFGAHPRIKAMHETLLAVLFIFKNASAIGTPHYIAEKDADYICNMDSEKYREQLISK